jgi:hypothetical protein
MLLLDGARRPHFRGGPVINYDNLNGMLWRRTEVLNPDTGMTTVTEGWVPGAILQLWRQLVAQTDPLQRRKKEGVRFLVRDASELVDKLRAVTNSLGIIIYPGVATQGEGKVVEDGTLADVNMVLIAQAVEDGSMLGFGGYGQGADNQDKAGGKAMTYAAKAILIQAAQLGGSKTAKALGIHDTDDTDTPIKGGVKPKVEKTSLAKLEAQLEEVETEEDYKELRPTLQALTPEDQQALTPAILAAKKRAGMPLPQPKAK